MDCADTRIFPESPRKSTRITLNRFICYLHTINMHKSRDLHPCDETIIRERSALLDASICRWSRIWMHPLISITTIVPSNVHIWREEEPSFQAQLLWHHYSSDKSHLLMLISPFTKNVRYDTTYSLGYLSVPSHEIVWIALKQQYMETRISMYLTY